MSSMTPEITGEFATARGSALSSHRFLMRLGFAAGNIFAWIFAFRGFYLASGSVEAALFGIAALYALMQGIIFVLTPLSGAALRHGMRRALAYGTLIAAFAFACFSVVFAPQVSGDFAFAMIATFIVFMGIHRALYWIPYRSEIADSGAFVRQSRIQDLAVAFMPLLAGVVIQIAWLGPEALLAIVALIILSALVPLIRIPESYEGFDWSFSETFRALFSPLNRRFLVLAMFDGVQGITLVLLWPIAVFIIIGQSFLGLGFLLAFTLLCAPFARGFARLALRRAHADQSTSIQVVLVISSWVARLAAGSPLQVVMADLYYHSGTSAKRFSVDMATFDQHADGAHYVDEYTALKEMGMALGRIFVCLMCIGGVLFFSAVATFAAILLLAATASAFSIIISRRLARGV